MENDGRVPDGTGLSQAEPVSRLGPTGFDPSRCIAIDNVEPIFVEQMILGAMAHRYMTRVPDLELDEALEAARATWDTDMDWEDPRDFEQAVAMVDADLEHWDD